MSSSTLIGRDAMRLKVLPLLSMPSTFFMRDGAEVSSENPRKILRKSLYPPEAFSETIL
jgi:hypothetical protein